MSIFILAVSIFEDCFTEVEHEVNIKFKLTF